MSDYLINLLRKKATSSPCTYKIAAVALTKKGNILGCSRNSYGQFNKHGGGTHAERKLIKKHGKAIYQIIIARVNVSGTFLPIEPCKTCQKIADKNGIKILSIK